MSEHEIEYALPISAVRITGTRTTTTDSTEDPANPTESVHAEASAELVLIADPGERERVRVKQGVFQVNVSLAFTDDGRLTSAASENTGEAGTLVKGVVALGTAVLGVALSPGWAGLAGVAAVSLLRSKQKDFAESIEEKKARDELLDPILTPVQKRYKEAHPTEADLLIDYHTLVAKLESSLVACLTNLDSLSKVADLRRLEMALRVAKEQLALLERHFQSWVASQITTRTERHEYVIPVTQLSAVTVDQGNIYVKDGSDPLSAAWKNLGLVAQIDCDQNGRVDPSANKGAEPFGGIYIRTPRSARLRVYRRREEGEPAAELVSSDTRLIVDQHSKVVPVEFRSSPWTRRKVTAGISSAGGLSSYEYGGGSAAAGLGETLGNLPENVAGSLEQVLSARTNLGKLRDVKADESLERAKRQLELKQTELAAAGVTATEADYVELARLKQQKDLLELRSAVTIVQATPEAASLAALKQQLELAATRRELATEQELGELRLEIAGLHPGNGKGRLTEGGSPTQG